MSVIVANLDFYDAVYWKLELYNNHNTVDVDYNEALRAFVYHEGDIKQLVKDWLYLNEWSYIRRYREDLNGEKPNLEPFLKFSSKKTLNAFEMLKALEFIVYNIELDTIKNGYSAALQEPCLIPENLMNSHKTLIEIMHSCRMMIIKQIPEYNQAKWGEI